MNDAQYILITKVMKEAKNVEWWEGQTTGEEEVRVFGTFAYAKEALITAVKTLTKKCTFFPYKRGKYLPYEEYWQARSSSRRTRRRFCSEKSFWQFSPTPARSPKA